MHPYITQALIDARVRDLRKQGAAGRPANEARRTRHGHGPIAADRVRARRRGTPRWA